MFLQILQYFFYFLVILDFYCQFFIYFLLDQNSKLYLEYCKPKLPLSITENQATLPSLFNQISTLLFLKLFSFIRKTPHSSVRKQEKMGSISLTKLTLGMGTGVLLHYRVNRMKSWIMKCYAFLTPKYCSAYLQSKSGKPNC